MDDSPSGDDRFPACEHSLRSPVSAGNPLDSESRNRAGRWSRTILARPSESGLDVTAERWRVGAGTRDGSDGFTTWSAATMWKGTGFAPCRCLRRPIRKQRVSAHHISEGGSPGHGAAGGGDREQGGRVRAAAGLVSRDRLIFCPFAEDVAGPPRKFSRTYRQHTPSSRAVRDRGGPPLRCGGERRAFPSRTHCVVQRYLFDDCEQTIGRRLGNPQSAMTEMMLKLVGVAAMVTVE
jgi:hypothetical protein